MLGWKIIHVTQDKYVNGKAKPHFEDGSNVKLKFLGSVVSCICNDEIWAEEQYRETGYFYCFQT